LRMPLVEGAVGLELLSENQHGNLYEYFMGVPWAWWV
jgi:hypothetical protein